MAACGPNMRSGPACFVLPSNIVRAASHHHDGSSGGGSGGGVPAVAPLVMYPGAHLATRSLDGILFSSPQSRRRQGVKVWRRPYSTATCVRCAAADDDGSGDGPRTWNLPGLRKEAARQVLRQLKRVGKAEVRHRKAEAAEGGAFDGQSADELLGKVEEEQARLEALTQLEADLALVKPKEGVVAGSELEATLLSLGVNDAPPPQAPRGPKKKKGPKGPAPSAGPRQAYRSFESADGIEIQVGRTAKDNDELSLGAARVYPRCWWLHAAGCPGSHVVIQCEGDDDGVALPKATVLDAAVLAANFSKAAGQRRVKVSLTRCRSITKPQGAKPGLVNINGGDVRTVTVDMKAEAARLERLQQQHPQQTAA